MHSARDNCSCSISFTTINNRKPRFYLKKLKSWLKLQRVHSSLNEHVAPHDTKNLPKYADDNVLGPDLQGYSYITITINILSGLLRAFYAKLG